MSLSLLSTTLLVLFSANIIHGEKTKLRIQVLVPYNNSVFSQEGAMAAVNLAVSDVNTQGILPDYELVANFSNTLCDSAEGTWQFIKSILDTDVDNETRIIAFVGGGCSLATEPTAALSGRLYEVVQISYGASSPILSQRSMYPHFFRTITSETLFNNARFALMSKYNWCYVATLHQTANLFSLTVQDFHDSFDRKLGNTGGPCADSDDDPILFSFTGDPEIPLSQIANKNIRIIFGYFYEDQAISVLCHAADKKLTSNNHLWVLPAWYSNEWWKQADNEEYQNFDFPCTSDIVEEALAYSILLDIYTYPEDEDIVSEAGYTNETFYSALNKSFVDAKLEPLTVTTQIYSSLAYDSVWALALALSKTEEDLEAENVTLSDFYYYYSGLELHIDPTERMIRNRTNQLNQLITNTLAKNLESTSFNGVTGRIRFDENGTRIGLTAVYQMRRVNGVLQKVLIATHDYENENLTITFDIDPIWRGGEAPTDRSTPVSRLLNQPLIYVMDMLIAVGIVVAVALLIFNIATITKPLTYNSAPYINMIIICGCIIVMIACILMGIDSGTPQLAPYVPRKSILLAEHLNSNIQSRYSAICTVRLWLLTIGFTLSFGALFSKTWQVYRVYTNNKLKDQPFKMWNFLILMGILLALDLIILIVWTAGFNFRHTVVDSEENRLDVTYKNEKCDCDSFAYLVGTMYVYKGLLVIFGLFLAYESRNVKYYYINDSRFVSVSMYIVVITIGISAPLSLVLAEQLFIDPAYAVAVAMTVTSCMACLLILHIPKFYYMAKGADTMLPQAKAETFTPVDALQLGRSDVNPEDIQSADKKIENLKEQVKQREHELQELQGRRGSDQDSGVMCTADEKDAPHSPDSPFNTTSTYIHTTIMESPEHESTFVTDITTVSGANDTTISQDRGNEEEQIGGGYPSTDSGNDAQL